MLVSLPLPRVRAARAWPCSAVLGLPWASALPPGGLVLEARLLHPLFGSHPLLWNSPGPPGPSEGLSFHSAFLLWDPRVRGRRDGWRRLARMSGPGLLLLPSGRGSSLPSLLCSPRVLSLLGGPRPGAWSAGVALSECLGDLPSLLLALQVMDS